MSLSTLRSRAESIAIPALWFGAAALFLRFVDKLHPLEEWQSPRFVLYALAVAVWVLGCWSLGLRLTLALDARLRVGETLVVAFPAGVLAFGIGVFGIGLVGGLFWPMFIALPLLALASGGRPVWRWLSRVGRHVRAFRSRGLRPDTATERVAFVLGIAAVVMILLPTISVGHLGFDSGWYHVPIAEHYVAAHRISAFREGWYLGAYPHLASLLYTWAGLCPWGTAVDRTLLCGVIETAVFLITLVSIPVLVRAVVGRTIRHAWAALFLFPIIYIADLEIAADHVAALFAVPLFLGLIRYLQQRTVARGLVVAAPIAGAMMTKYSAFPMIVAPVFAIAFVAVQDSVRTARREGWRGLWSETFRSATATAVGILALTAPHWLSNLVWYGDPLYPVLHRWAHPHPWSSSAAYLSDFYMHDLSTFHPKRTAGGLAETGKAMFGFSFRSLDFWGMHRDWPFVGSLFTFATFTLPFLRAPRRLWLLFGACYVTLFAWYSQSHVERYLQAPLPLLVVALVGALMLATDRGKLARASVFFAVTVQTLWGLSVFGLPAMQRKLDQAELVVTHSYTRDRSDLSFNLRSWMEIGKVLPTDARPLLHERWIHTGLERASLTDVIGTQAAFDYGSLPDARALHELFVKTGVTHLIAGGNSSQDDSIGGDLRFWQYERRHARKFRDVAGHRISLLASTPPPPPPTPELVYVHMCHADDPYRSGLYPFLAMNRAHLGSRWHGPVVAPAEPEAAPTDGPKLLARATFAVVRTDCTSAPSEVVQRTMTSLVDRGPYRLYVANSPPGESK
jgi:hypothetical protein